MNKNLKTVTVQIEQRWINMLNLAVEKTLVPEVNKLLAECFNDLFLLEVQNIKSLIHDTKDRPLPGNIYIDAIKCPRKKDNLVPVNIIQHHNIEKIENYLYDTASLTLSDYANSAVKMTALYFINDIPYEAYQVEDPLIANETEEVIEDIFLTANVLIEKRKSLIADVTNQKTCNKRSIKLDAITQKVLDKIVESGGSDVLKDIINCNVAEKIMETIFNYYDDDSYLEFLTTPVVLYLDIRKENSVNKICLFIVDSDKASHFSKGLDMFTNTSIDETILSLVSSSIHQASTILANGAKNELKSEPLDMDKIKNVLSHLIATAIRIQKRSTTK